MKVKCIDNKYYKNKLIIGKIYECDVCITTDEYYKITNDDGYENGYRKELFKTLSEIRNETIDKLLE